MMRETSLAALHEHAVSGALLTQKMSILEFLKINGPHTRQQIADVLEEPVPSVCGRIRELLDSELVQETKRVKNPSGKSAYLVEAV